jgi:DNA polymerase III alpha subunit
MVCSADGDLRRTPGDQPLLFPRGASAPEELFSKAALLGHKALGLTDHGSVADVVRGWAGQKDTGVRMIPGRASI